MDFLQAIVLGIVQGITELLPISSSGHLIFVPHLFDWPDQGLAFDVMVHIGTLFAVVVYFRHRIWSLLRGLFSWKVWDKPNKTLAWLIILATVPAGIAGLILKDLVATHLRSPLVVGINLIFWGLVLWFADNYSRRAVASHDAKDLDNLSWKDTLFIGFAQALALIPGTSRSGITITAGLLGRIKKEAAIELSFLMSVPIIGAAGLLKIFELQSEGLGTLTFGILGAGLFTSFLGGILAIWGLLKIVRRWSFMPFVIYRIVVGLLILNFLA